MLTFAKLIYGHICTTYPDDMSEEEALAIAAKVFQEMVDRLNKRSGDNIVPLPTTA